MRKMTMALLGATVAAAAMPLAAQAAPVVSINFEGASNPGTTTTVIGEFYNGGTDSGGTAGPNVGVSFVNANVDSQSRVTSFAGITSNIAYMAATPLTFSTAFAFRSFAFDQFFFAPANSITVYDGAGGTGNVLYQGIFEQNCGSTCAAVRNNVSFAGQGRSVSIAPNANGTGIDNLTISAVPEAATWTMMILGFGAIGAALRRRKAGAGTTVTA